MDTHQPNSGEDRTWTQLSQRVPLRVGWEVLIERSGRWCYGEITGVGERACLVQLLPSGQVEWVSRAERILVVAGGGAQP